MGKNRTKKNPYMKKGEKHNRLTAMEDAYNWEDKILFECECNNQKYIRASSVKYNEIKSCKCLHKERLTKHSYYQHPLYARWNSMMTRCYNSNSHDYKDYGGRGIKICKEWKNNPAIFIEWAIKNGWKKELQINRIDNDGDYCPKNCEFITPSQNCRNRNNNHWLTAFKETKTLIEWSEDKRCKVNYRCLIKRIRYNWSPERALTTKSQRKHK